jgi:hypothetical protein
MRESAIATILAIITACAVTHTEVRSGFWTLLQPSRDSLQTRIDLSELTPFCELDIKKCRQAIADADFSAGNTISAPFGICTDSAISAAIQTRYMSGKNIAMDREGLFYLDSMMKAYSLLAPQTDFTTKIAGSKALYFLRTSENRTAVIIKIGEYIGGIDRTYYYWAYQSDTGRVLFKNVLYELPKSLYIDVDVFSGRANPPFVFSNAAGIAQIIHAIYVGVNAYLDPSIKRSDTIQCPTWSGYRSMSVMGMFNPEDPLSSTIPAITICNSSILYYTVAGSSSITPPRTLYDPNLRLAKLIARVGCETDLTTKDSYGTIRFCDIIPDSLKPVVEIEHDHLGANPANSPPTLMSNSAGVLYRVNSAGRIRMDLFDPQGRKIACLVDRFHQSGTFQVDLRIQHPATGVYVLRCSRPAMTDVVSTILFK